MDILDTQEAGGQMSRAQRLEGYQASWGSA
jgi:hypothetical protein